MVRHFITLIGGGVFPFTSIITGKGEDRWGGGMMQGVGDSRRDIHFFSNINPFNNASWVHGGVGLDMLYNKILG